MRRLLPAIIGLLLLLSAAIPTVAADPSWREDFEGDLSAWTLRRSGAGSVELHADAAAAGTAGLLVRAGGGTARALRALPNGTGVIRLAFDVRHDGTRAASILTLSRNGRAVLRLIVGGDGAVYAIDRTGARHSRLGTLPDGRFRRLRLRVDPKAGTTRLRIGTASKRFATPGGRPQRVGLGGSKRTSLAFDSVVAAASAPSPMPSPSVEPSPSVSPAPSPSPSSSPTADTTFRFTGRGSDHGVGMSQTGAHGRAKAGQLYPEILAHYYLGTIVETRPALLTRTIRVLVTEATPAPAADPLVACGRRGTWTIEGSDLTFPGGACARFVAGVTGNVVVTANDDTELWRADGEEWLLVPVAESTLLDLPARAPRNLLRGSLRVVMSRYKGQVVNIVPVESYLRSVVPLEMSPSRPTEALRAQAVAARSYALYHVRATNPVYDVHDDSRSQVYGGFSAEHVATDAAVADTAGQVATYAGKVINAVFHAQGGGATEDARNVFNPADGSQGTDVPYLRGSPDLDPEGIPYDKGGGYDSWRTGTFTMARLSAWMAADPRTDVGSIARLILSDRGVSGRLISVTLVGMDGTRKTVAGWLFKSVFNAQQTSGDPLRSTLFERKVVP